MASGESMAGDSIGLIFAGQGAQHPGMGMRLYGESADARRLYDDADRILGWPLSRLCFEGSIAELTACAHCQPAIYVTSLAAMAARFPGGLEGVPDAKITICGGLSLGELAAFTAAGAMEFADGLRAVAMRGKFMDDACRKHPGGMAAVIGAPADVVAQICGECGIDVANYNCEGQLIISGEKTGLEKAAAALAAVAMKIVPLEVAGAYHSRLMREAAMRFREYLDSVPMRLPAIPVVHNVTGEIAERDVIGLRDRLGDQIHLPVRWESCARTMIDHCNRMLELGPGHVLSGLMKRICRKFPVESSDL